MLCQSIAISFLFPLRRSIFCLRFAALRSCYTISLQEINIPLIKYSEDMLMPVVRGTSAMEEVAILKIKYAGKEEEEALLMS